jgi:hypothetical protein
LETTANFNLLNQYATHVGSARCSCLGGTAEGEFIGQRLFDGV